jgi:hypothetical protein
MRLRWLSGKEANSVADGEIKQLTDQFYVTLRAYVAKMHSLDGKLAPDALQRLKDLLSSNRPRSWTEAYEIEQLVVHLFDEETLRTELRVRRLEARRTFHSSLVDLYAKDIEDANSPERQRSVLARLVNDLQWRYTVNEVKRRYSQDITSRTGWLFAFSLGLFGSLIAYTALWKPPFDDLRLLLFAASAGTWGATFSMLASLKSRLTKSELDDMKLMRPLVMLCSRMLIGTGAGCVLYFFLRSGLLGGSAFPQLATLELVQGVSAKDLAWLIVWCFIAGFSEKFVPSILEKTETRATSTASTETDRFRPGSNGAAGLGQSATNGSERDSEKHAEPRKDAPTRT